MADRRLAALDAIQRAFAYAFGLSFLMVPASLGLYLHVHGQELVGALVVVAIVLLGVAIVEWVRRRRRGSAGARDVRAPMGIHSVHPLIVVGVGAVFAIPGAALLSFAAPAWLEGDAGHVEEAWMGLIFFMMGTGVMGVSMIDWLKTKR